MTGRAGVLIVNLGTPEAPTPAAVRRFLAEFLDDPRVVDLPRIPRRILLRGVILPLRAPRSARAYRSIWTAGGSPLLVHTRALARAVRASLTTRGIADAQVAAGMTYGHPSIAAALETLRSQRVERLLLLPLYPQYSRTTTEAAFDRVTAALRGIGWQPELLRVRDYHADAGYIAALVESLAGRIADLAAGAHLLFSFHGLPQRNVDAGDPYRFQCEATALDVATRLALPPRSWSLAFQSRAGFARWTGPYTTDRLRSLAGQEPRRVVVCCPGFAVDCLETLEEIAIRGRGTFLAAGGATFDYVPALNERTAHADALADIARRSLAGAAIRAAS